MKILVSTGSLDNRGHMGVVISLVNYLRENIPSADITVMPRTFKRDENILNRWISNGNISVSIVKHPWYVEGNSMLICTACSMIKGLALFSINFFSKVLNKMGWSKKSPYQQYDLIIDLQLSEIRDTTLFNALASAFVAFNALFFAFGGKPVIACNASIGKPFKSKLLRSLLKFAFNKLGMIITRDDFSNAYLKEIGVNKPKTFTLPDISFLLFPSSLTTRSLILGKSRKPIIGIVLRDLFSSGIPEEEYINFFVKLADFIAEGMKGTAIFIPYSFSGWFDDRKVIQRVYSTVRNKTYVRVVYDDLLPEELKGIIKECDILISWRFHPALQAVSLCVPIIGVTGGGKIKFDGIIGRLAGQEKWLIYTEGRKGEDLLKETEQKIRLIWKEYEEVKRRLRERVGIIAEQIPLLAELVKEFEP